MIQAEVTESQKWMRGVFLDLTELTPDEKAQRVDIIRSIAERSREDAAARSFTEWLVQQAESDLPTEAQVFRAYYLDGLTARQAGRALHMDKRNVHRCNRRIMEAMLPLAFGLDGLYKKVCERPILTHRGA